jgi:hypothetical protein
MFYLLRRHASAHGMFHINITVLGLVFITLACHRVTLTSSSPLIAHKRSCLDRPRSTFIIPGLRGGWAQPQSTHSSAGRPQHARGARVRLSDPGQEITRSRKLRASHLIDPEGVLRQIATNVPLARRSVDEALRLIQTFEFTVSRLSYTF